MVTKMSRTRGPRAEATLLAQAVRNGELTLEEPVARYVTELARDNDIGRVTLGHLATHTSGLLLPQDHPPWPDWGYTLPEFISTLNEWKADKPPGMQHTYTHGGYILLQLALERRYGTTIDELIEQRILRPLGMTSTTLPRGDESPRGHLSPEEKRRAVQGYADDGTPVGEPAAKRVTIIGEAITAPTTKHEKMPAMRVALERLLNQQRQALVALPHIRVAGRQPNPCTARERNHGRRSRTSITRASTVASTPWSMITRCPRVSTISIRPGAATGHAGHGEFSAASRRSGNDGTLPVEGSRLMIADAKVLVSSASTTRPSRARRRKMNKSMDAASRSVQRYLRTP